MNDKKVRKNICDCNFVSGESVMSLNSTVNVSAIKWDILHFIWFVDHIGKKSKIVIKDQKCKILPNYLKREFVMTKSQFVLWTPTSLMTEGN